MVNAEASNNMNNMFCMYQSTPTVEKQYAPRNEHQNFANCISNTILVYLPGMTPTLILNSQMDRCLLFIPKQHMGESLTNTKKGYMATYTNSCGLRSRN